METYKLFLIALGIYLVMEGMPYALFPTGMKRMLAQLPLLPNNVLRAIGIVAVAGGFLLVIWAKG